MIQYIVLTSIISVSTLIYLRRKAKNKTKKLIYTNIDDEEKRVRIVKLRDHPARMWLRDI